MNEVADFQGRKRLSLELNMAPLIDVVFLLLIFYMLSSTFVRPEAVKVNLPSASSGQAVSLEALEVFLRRDGSLVFGEQEISIDSLQEVVRKLIDSKPEQVITLKADADVSVQKMVEVMDQMKLGGARKNYIGN